MELSAEDEEAEKQLDTLKRNDEQKENVRRIRAKALMRRARAKTELDGWANLQGAEEDYRELMGMENLPPQDKKIVQKALRELPNRINQAREKEIGEMMGKLKDVGSIPSYLVWLLLIIYNSLEMESSSLLVFLLIILTSSKMRRRGVIA